MTDRTQVRDVSPRPALLVVGVDGALVVLLALAAAWADGKSPVFFAVERTALLVGAVLPFAPLVGLWAWRDVRRFAHGDAGLRRPAMQAFLLGFLPRPLNDTIGIVREAFAAGPPWPSPGHASVGEWIAYGGEVLAFSTLVGMFMALLATPLALANRALYAKLADMELQSDGASPCR